MNRMLPRFLSISGTAGKICWSTGSTLTAGRGLLQIGNVDQKVLPEDARYTWAGWLEDRGTASAGAPAGFDRGCTFQNDSRHEDQFSRMSHAIWLPVFSPCAITSCRSRWESRGSMTRSISTNSGL